MPPSHPIGASCVGEEEALASLKMHLQSPGTSRPFLGPGRGCQAAGALLAHPGQHGTSASVELAVTSRPGRQTQEPAPLGSSVLGDSQCTLSSLQGDQHQHTPASTTCAARALLFLDRDAVATS